MIGCSTIYPMIFIYHCNEFVCCYKFRFLWPNWWHQKNRLPHSKEWIWNCKSSSTIILISACKKFVLFVVKYSRCIFDSKYYIAINWTALFYTSFFSILWKLVICHVSWADIECCWLPFYVDKKSFQVGEACDIKETPEQRFQRLQHEIRELAEDLNAIKVRHQVLLELIIGFSKEHWTGYRRSIVYLKHDLVNWLKKQYFEWHVTIDIMSDSSFHFVHFAFSSIERHVSVVWKVVFVRFLSQLAHFWHANYCCDDFNDWYCLVLCRKIQRPKAVIIQLLWPVKWSICLSKWTNYYLTDSSVVQTST
jgi:hypothetical protein